MDRARRERIKKILDDQVRWAKENPKEARQWLIDTGFILDNGDLHPDYRRSEEPL